MMIKFNLQQFEPVPEGERVLKIKEAKCVPSGKPTKIEITFEDIATNRTLKNNYNLSVEGAVKSFGFLCRKALNMPDMDSFDTNTDMVKLINKKLICEVIHTEGNQAREDGTLPVFANIKSVIDRFEDEEKAEIVSPRNSIPTGDLD